MLYFYEVLGIWDCSQKCLVAARIPDRSAATMRPIFRYFCNPGIEITTDAWKGYNFLRPDSWRYLMVVHKRYNQLPKCGGSCVCVLEKFRVPFDGSAHQQRRKNMAPYETVLFVLFISQR